MLPVVRKSKLTDLEEFILMKKLYLDDATKVTGDKIVKSDKEIKREFLDALKKGNANMLILEYNKKILGFMKITLFKDKKVSYLDDIFVKSEFQGKGYGKLLFEYFLNFSKKQKFEKMGLGARVENKRAISMYKKYGFKIIGYNFGKRLK